MDYLPLEILSGRYSWAFPYPAAHHLFVLHQAVLARRMRSKTYKDLSWILLLVSAISIVTAPSGICIVLLAEAALKSVDKALFVLSHVSSVCAALLGLQIGYFGPEE